MPTALPRGGKTAPNSHKSPSVKILQSGTNFQTRIISHPCGRDGLHLPATGREQQSARPAASRRDSQRTETRTAPPAPEKPGPRGLRGSRGCQVPRGVQGRAAASNCSRGFAGPGGVQHGPPNPAIRRNRLPRPQCCPSSRVTFSLDPGVLEDILPSVQSPLTQKSLSSETLGPCVGCYVQWLPVQC